MRSLYKYIPFGFSKNLNIQENSENTKEINSFFSVLINIFGFSSRVFLPILFIIYLSFLIDTIDNKVISDVTLFGFSFAILSSIFTYFYFKNNYSLSNSKFLMIVSLLVLVSFVIFKFFNITLYIYSVERFFQAFIYSYILFLIFIFYFKNIVTIEFTKLKFDKKTRYFYLQKEEINTFKKSILYILFVFLLLLSFLSFFAATQLSVKKITLLQKIEMIQNEKIK